MRLSPWTATSLRMVSRETLTWRRLASSSLLSSSLTVRTWPNLRFFLIYAHKFLSIVFIVFLCSCFLRITISFLLLPPPIFVIIMNSISKMPHLHYSFMNQALTPQPTLPSWLMEPVQRWSCLRRERCSWVSSPRRTFAPGRTLALTLSMVIIFILIYIPIRLWNTCIYTSKYLYVFWYNFCFFFFSWVAIVLFMLSVDSVSIHFVIMFYIYVYI